MTNTETRESETPKRLGFKSAGAVRVRKPITVQENAEALCGEAEKGGAFRGYFR